LTKEKDVNYEPEFCLKMPILHAPESKQSKYETRIANKNKTHFKTWTNQPLLSNQDSDNKITFNIENTHRTNHKMRQIKI